MKRFLLGVIFFIPWLISLPYSLYRAYQDMYNSGNYPS